jgi:very-short-patch-repair endonuclease
VWRLLMNGGLEPPTRQHEVVDESGGFVGRIDLAYPGEKLAIEADGYDSHSQREDWQRDRTRQNALIAAGWIVYRITWADAARHPRRVVDDVARLLAARRVLLVPAGT